MGAVCVDWDDTLVDARSQQWLPESQRRLRDLLARGYQVIVHTSRANWPEGAATVAAKLVDAGFRAPHVIVVAKPHAVAYIDNLGFRWDDNWTEILRQIPPTATVARKMGLVV